MYQQYLDMGQNWAPNNWIVNEYSIGHNWTNICGPPGLLFWPTPMLVGGFLSSEKWWSSSVGMTIPNYTYTNPTIYKLVGGFNPSENMSQLGWLFPYIMEKKTTCSTPPTSSVFPNRMSYRTVSAMKDSGDSSSSVHCVLLMGPSIPWRRDVHIWYMHTYLWLIVMGCKPTLTAISWWFNGISWFNSDLAVLFSGIEWFNSDLVVYSSPKSLIYHDIYIYSWTL